jgi:hypothetical protein
MSKKSDKRLTDLILGSLSENEKLEILEQFDKYYSDSEGLREKCLEGKSQHLRPVFSINFGWVCQLALCK